jgi:hypothetical protein
MKASAERAGSRQPVPPVSPVSGCRGTLTAGAPPAAVSTLCRWHCTRPRHATSPGRRRTRRPRPGGRSKQSLAAAVPRACITPQAVTLRAWLLWMETSSVVSVGHCSLTGRSRWPKRSGVALPTVVHLRATRGPGVPPPGRRERQRSALACSRVRGLQQALGRHLHQRAEEASGSGD